MKKLIGLPLFLLLIVGCSSPKYVDPDTLYLKGRASLDTVSGIEDIKVCANQGHGGCAQILGGLYYYARGVSRDLEKAERWQLLAWETGIDYGYAGVLGATHAAFYYCNEPSYKAGSKKISILLDSADEILDVIAENSLIESSSSEEKVILSIRSDIQTVRNNLIKGECVNA